MIRKILAIPFVILGVPLLTIGLVIKYGIDNSILILENFKTSIEKYK